MVCYTVQIYFDFSGYSDMAIGLGRMFGFRLLENFDYPYVSRSITEFWRRWHISLSSWFRDYLYIPLGGNRRVGPRAPTFNLVCVFLLCGLWHGAAWNFVAWGLYHGGFLVVERLGLGGWLRPALGRVVRHALRPLGRHGRHGCCSELPSLGHRPRLSRGHVRSSRAGDALTHAPVVWFDSVLAVALLAGAVGSTPWLPRLSEWLAATGAASSRAPPLGGARPGLAALGSVSCVWPPWSCRRAPTTPSSTSGSDVQTQRTTSPLLDWATIVVFLAAIAAPTVDLWVEAGLGPLAAGRVASSGSATRARR